MAIKITSQRSLWCMQNAITQANKALDHKIESDIREQWALLMGSMIDCRKLAMKKNEEYEEMKNA